VLDHGEIVHSPSLEEIRRHAAAARAELPDSVREVAAGPAAMLATVV
jgi:hypothetical protein